MKGMAAYAHHALRLGKRGRRASRAWFYKGLCAVAERRTRWRSGSRLSWSSGSVNLQCMALLDRGEHRAYSATPVPTRVPHGHPGRAVHRRLRDTTCSTWSSCSSRRRGQACDVYTHCEMLPAHGYPGLNKYPHLAGNFGTAWQSQQREFEDIPAPGAVHDQLSHAAARRATATASRRPRLLAMTGLRHIEADALRAQGLFTHHPAGASSSAAMSTTAA